MNHPSATEQPGAMILAANELFLCRASGEGSHNFRICEDEAAVLAFYEEMCGKEEDGTLDMTIKHLRDEDNWSNSCTAYEVKLYCATFEVWKVDSTELPLRSAGQIGWLCYTANGARHFVWKDQNEPEEMEWLDKRYPRREPVYTRSPQATGKRHPDCVYPEECKKLGKCIRPDDHDSPPACGSNPQPTELERKVAAKLGDDPHAIARRRTLLEANEAVIEKYVEGYEWDAGEDGYHVPTEQERMLVEDAIHGLLADDGFVQTFNAWQDECRRSTVATGISEDALFRARAHAHFLKGYAERGGANLPEVLERAEKIIADLASVSATADKEMK